MKEPKKIPLTNHPRSKEPLKRSLYPEPITDDLWERHESNFGPPIFAKKNYENHLENNSQSIQELESDQTN